MTLTQSLQYLGYSVAEWDMPGWGRQIQITSKEDGKANGMTVYLPENTTLEQCLQRMKEKREQFDKAEQQ